MNYIQISEPAFDQLRTKEQLGYIVFTGLKRLNQQYLSLHIIVQSSHKDADYLDNRIEAFLHAYREQLIGLSEETFKENVTAVIEKLVEKPKNIEEVIAFFSWTMCTTSALLKLFNFVKECDQLWTEVSNGMYWFGRKPTLAKALRSGAVTQSSLLLFFDEFVGACSPLRRKFSSQFYGKGKRYVNPVGSGAVEVVEEPVEFRRAHSLMPVPKFTPV